MNNVVKFHQKTTIPDDLMTFKEVFEQYGYRYGFLYKWSILEKEIPCYEKRGFIAIRESDLLKFIDERIKKWRA